MSARLGCWSWRQDATRRDAELPLHEIDPRHQLGDGVLDLDARVDFEEGEGAVGAEQKLAGRYSPKSDLLGDPARVIVETLPDLGANVRRRSLLDHLLVAALEGAIAVAEHQRLLPVGDNLHLDMPRVDELSLEVDEIAGTRGGALPSRRRHRL